MKKYIPLILISLLFAGLGVSHAITQLFPYQISTVGGSVNQVLTNVNGTTTWAAASGGGGSTSTTTINGINGPTFTFAAGSGLTFATSGTTLTYTNGAPNFNTTTSLNGLTGAITGLNLYEATATINGLQPNSGIFTLVAGTSTAISTSSPGTINIWNLGVLSASAGSGITVSSATGTITITNSAPNFNGTTTWGGISGAITFSTSTGNNFFTISTSSQNVAFTLSKRLLGIDNIATSTANLIVGSSTSINGWTGLTVGADNLCLAASSTAATGVGLGWQACSGSGGTTSPGGSNKQIQYNNASTFAGDANFTWSSSTALLAVTGTSTISGSLAVGTTTLPIATSTLFTVGSSTTGSYLNVFATGTVSIGTSTALANPGLLVVGGAPSTLNNAFEVRGPTGVMLFQVNEEGLILNKDTGAISTSIALFKSGGTSYWSLSSTAFQDQLQDVGLSANSVQVGGSIGIMTSASQAIKLQGYRDVSLEPNVASGGVGGGSVIAKAGVAGNPVLFVQGKASQTAALQIWQNSASTTLSFIDNNGNLSIGTSTALIAGDALFVNGSSTFSGHLNSTSTAGIATTTVSSCGTNPSVSGTDTAGKVSLGGGSVTACTVNFGVQYKQPPVCTVSDNSTTPTIDINAITTSTLVANFSVSLSGGTMWYICVGNY